MHLRSPTMQQPVRAVHSRDAPQGHEVVAYLASGGGGAPGTSLQRQALMRLLTQTITINYCNKPPSPSPSPNPNPNHEPGLDAAAQGGRRRRRLRGGSKRLRT